MDKRLERVLLISAGVLAALVLGSCAISYVNTRDLHQNAEWVAHTLQVLDRSNELSRAILDTEVKMRGFVITGDDAFLAKDAEADAAIREMIKSLREMSGDNPLQQKRLDALATDYAALGRIREEAIARRRKSLADAVAFITVGPMKKHLDGVRATVAEFREQERQLLGTREQDTVRAYRVAITFIVINAALGLTGVAGCVWLLQRAIAIRSRNADSLRRHVDDLAKSNAELEQFAYVASHDLQEPLRAISGCVQILQNRYKEKLDAPAEELIAHTVEGAARMRTLINDLLAYSRITTRGKQFTPTDAGAALKQALANLETSIQETQARITSDPLPTVDADMTQLAQLFQNLIGNAIKFAREKPPTIHVGVRREDDWVFSVRDNGIGIAPEYYERIFVVFQRLHTRSEYPGTGIGLSICRKIVERHGGRVWVESERGQGSTFFFTLPDRSTAVVTGGKGAATGIDHDVVPGLPPAKIAPKIPQKG